ncbi:MAG: malate synthase A [Ignavibacteriales bacterium]|nr:malate synthase A [Ignavibacteriales bacterium]
MKTGSIDTKLYRLPEGVQVTGEMNEEYASVLTYDALHFVATLQREFAHQRKTMLEKRVERQSEINLGVMPKFLPATTHIRQSYWRVAPTPQDLLDRRVEITGPTDKKMIINALNSGANMYMADFEDSNSPTWRNMVEGQANLCKAVDRTLTYKSPEGKHYSIGERPATLMVRPRGWHLDEKHVLVDGHPVSGSLFDFGIFFFHNAKKLLENNSGPYFYLPKLENHKEARLWNDVFLMAEDELDLPHGTIRATVLIENILAAFEMHEILYELRDHSAGLNCGRWDYIFSIIKKFRRYREFIFGDRSRLTMQAHFLHSYSLLLIQTCHKRGAHAMGGMAAQIPIKNNPLLNDEALMKIKADKEREVEDGHDGTWVAHPALVPIAKATFNSMMPGPNQTNRKRDDVDVEAHDLLAIPKGEITENGIRTNITVALQYIDSWIHGTGCVPIFNLMEDVATAEICRAQLWQWLHHQNVPMADKRRITANYYDQLVNEESQKFRSRISGGIDTTEVAKAILNRLVLDREFTDFFTHVAYNYLE